MSVERRCKSTEPSSGIMIREEKGGAKATQGKLYLCATPIGNLEDITLRVLRTLKEVDLIAAEDTRNSIKLLNHFEIKTPMTSYHEYNRIEKAYYLIGQMKEGKNVALITDAGTPGISDPGEDLVRLCYEAGIEVTSLPGAAACITALTLSGLSTRRFCFEAFLPSDKKEKQLILEELKLESRTIILYEAPHRLVRTLEELLAALGDRRATICRELTKKHETAFTTTLGEALEHFRQTDPKGECVIVIEGKSHQEMAQEAREKWEELSVEEHMEHYLSQGIDKKEAMKKVAKDRGVPKRVIYQALLTLVLLLFCVGCAGGSKTASNDPYLFVAQVLQPVAEGTDVLSEGAFSMDISDTSKGYTIASYDGTMEKVNIQLTGPDGIVYKYFVTAEDGETVLPLTGGDGTYALEVYEHIADDQYSALLNDSFEVSLESEFLPFLYPNQYVNFSENSEAIKLAGELSADAADDLTIVQNVFNYVTEHIVYDYDKAKNVPYGYLPDIDDTLRTGTGICFDYAALTCAMLRCRGIPAKLDIGYTNDGMYHAWISTYLKEKGWVDNIIEFNGDTWQLMDPTMTAASSTEAEKKQVMKDSESYMVQYVR